MSRLFRRVPIWVPTPFFMAVVAVPAMLLTVFFAVGAESFFSLTERRPSTVLVVESWIGYEGLRAAEQEYRTGGYKRMLLVGGAFENSWGDERWDYAIEASEYLLRRSFPGDQMLVVSGVNPSRDRTYAYAQAAFDHLKDRGLLGGGITIFTLGAHARRSRLVYQRRFERSGTVSAVAWFPERFQLRSHWYQSSERAEAVGKELLAYPYELLMWSGRWLP